jgi:metal-responsive CopG/Arc/MetJ family transcriptional regulator
MVRSKKAESSATGTVRQDVRLSLQTIKALDRWAERNGVTRSQAIRQLLKAALRASGAAAKIKMTNR